MKTGKTLHELALEIERQQASKRDFVVNSKALALTADGDKLAFGQEMVGVNNLAHRQIAEYTGIPAKYYDRMKEQEPALLANNVNKWLQRDPAPRLVRTLDGKARAFLSDKYRPLENADLAEAALPALLDLQVQIVSCEITETRLYIKAVDDRIQRDIPKGAKMGDGSHHIFDTVSPGIVISNSEVGLGMLSVQTSIWTKACTNLAIFAERSIRKTHVGARHEIADGLVHLLSDQTRRLTDAALWAQVRDVVKGAFNELRFNEIADQLAGAAQDTIEGDVVKAVDFAAKKYGVNETERNSILKNLIAGGDLSRYGLSAAVTRAAEDLGDYDRATEFERVGGQIIELPKNEWKEIALAA